MVWYFIGVYKINMAAWRSSLETQSQSVSQSVREKGRDESFQVRPIILHIPLNRIQ